MAAVLALLALPGAADDTDGGEFKILSTQDHRIEALDGVSAGASLIGVAPKVSRDGTASGDARANTLNVVGLRVKLKL